MKEVVLGSDAGSWSLASGALDFPRGLGLRFKFGKNV